MLKRSRQKIKKLLNAFGVEVHRYDPASSPSARLIAALQAFDIDIVVDIGANEGQFAKGLRAGGYTHKIVSFEPLAHAHAKLLENKRHDLAWQVHPRCALGDQHGEIELNVSENSVSSSVLPMFTTHSSAAPNSVYVGSETVPLTTVDKAVFPYLENAYAPLLKIDTQGYEWQVLDGALMTLPKVKGILIELSLVPLYRGQHLWRDCVDRLQAEGFELWSLEPAFLDLEVGRTLQWDGLFFRS
ncbi:FkbM family methyltransferase [Roseovarius sp. 10]|uniref:FkbM family methyltransferase n=1 Tax=Roseovarius sp. 10 TaxID=3080563 RepID=UPI00295529E0|nr:FkbM family methyltransferase [Roseovarius sp. 10]MDV7199729.1 FkbM family methyltransferase [Roseovarius sp. 10]